HDSTVCDQQASPCNHTAIIEVIVSDYLEFGLVSAAYILIGNLLRLDVFMQFLLAIFQPDSDIRRAFDPPKEIEVITEARPLIESGHSAKKTVLSLKNDGRILKRSCLLVLI